MNRVRLCLLAGIAYEIKFDLTFALQYELYCWSLLNEFLEEWQLKYV